MRERTLELKKTRSAIKGTGKKSHRRPTTRNKKIATIHKKKIHRISIEEMEEMADSELVQLIKEGNENAFGIIVKRYESKAFSLAIGLTKNQEDAEEVLQDVFLTVHRKIDSFLGKSAFSSWLYRITVNAAFMKLRKNKQEKSSPVEEITPAMESEWREVSHNVVPTAEDEACEYELKEILADAIAKLPDDYRAVFILRDVDGLSNKEVGEILNLTTPAVKSRLHRARIMLRKKLSRYYRDYTNKTDVCSLGHSAYTS